MWEKLGKENSRGGSWRTRESSLTRNDRESWRRSLHQPAVSGSAGQAQVVIGQLGQRQGKKSCHRAGEIKGKLEPMKTTGTHKISTFRILYASLLCPALTQNHTRKAIPAQFSLMYIIYLILFPMTIIHKFLFDPLSYPNILQILQMNASRR